MNDNQSLLEGEYMDKKEMIVRAAIAVFREKGIDKTKISDIVKAAGIAQGTFYLYFPSKLSLMPAIAEKMVDVTMQEVNRFVNLENPFPIQLQQLIDSIFHVNQEYHEIQALIYSGLASTEHLKEWETVYDPFYRWVSQRLKEAKKEQSVRTSIQEDHTAKLLIGLIESAAEQIYLYDTNKEDQAKLQKEQVYEFLSYALGLPRTT